MTIIRQLKREKEKAAGHDELRVAVEHLQCVHHISVALLSLLFNMLVRHGMVPLDFGKGVIIPSIKNPYVDKTSCDSFKQGLDFGVSLVA